MQSITCIHAERYVERVSLYWNILYTQMKMPIHTSTFSARAISFRYAGALLRPNRAASCQHRNIRLEVCSSGSVRPLRRLPRHIHGPHHHSHWYIFVCVCECRCFIESNFMCMDLLRTHSQIGYKI